MTCLMCHGTGHIPEPYLSKDKETTKKREAAQRLREEGYSYKDIMQMLGYRSIGPVRYLLKTQ